jgi:dTMP kinase
VDSAALEVPNGDGRRGIFIVITGTDGSGKSSVSAGLANRLSASGTKASWLTHREVPDVEPTFAKEHLSRLVSSIWEGPREPQDIFGHRHYFLLLSAWYDAIDRLVVRPALSAGRTIISDGWIYKVIAKSANRPEIGPALVHDCFAGLTTPDLIILLDVDPEICAARKDCITDAEAGLHDGWTGNITESFIGYQRTVRRALMTYLADSPVLRTVDGRSMFPEVLSSCEREVGDVLEISRSARAAGGGRDEPG